MRDILRWIRRGFGARIGWVLAGVLLLALGFDAKADPVCSADKVGEWYVQYTATIFGAPGNYGCSVGDTSSDANALAAQCVPPHGTYAAADRHWEGTFGPAYNTSGTGTLYAPDARIHRNDNENFIQSVNDFVDIKHRCITPPPPPVCDIPANDYMGIAESSDPALICFSGCKGRRVEGSTWSIGGADTTLYQYRSEGTPCDGSDTLFTPDGDSPGCASEGGTDVCVHGEPEPAIGDDQAGVDSPVPLEDLDTEGCVVLESGAAFCIASFPDQVDNGIPGQPATPDATGEVTSEGKGEGDSGTSTTYNYYSSSTVNNSTNKGEGDPDGDGGDSTGECDPATEECGSARGDGRVTGKGGTTQGMKEALEAFNGRIKDAPLAKSLDVLSGIIPAGGDCPTASFTLLDTSFTLDSHCDLLDNIYPLLAKMFLLFWLIAGAVVVLRS